MSGALALLIGGAVPALAQDSASPTSVVEGVAASDGAVHASTRNLTRNDVVAANRADDGRLTPIPGSTQKPNGGASSGRFEITFTPRGDVLLISQPVVNSVAAITVGADGVAKGPIVSKPLGSGPVGLALAIGELLTTENVEQGKEKPAWRL